MGPVWLVFKSQLNFFQWLQAIGFCHLFIYHGCSQHQRLFIVLKSIQKGGFVSEEICYSTSRPRIR